MRRRERDSESHAKRVGQLTAVGLQDPIIEFVCRTPQPRLHERTRVSASASHEPTSTTRPWHRDSPCPEARKNGTLGINQNFTFCYLQRYAFCARICGGHKYGSLRVQRRVIRGRS